MKDQSRKVVLVGTGFVGMSYAYALLNQNACDELVLIDIDRKKAEGEAMDLNHGLAFSGSHMKISPGDYSDCHDADIVAISAGVSQRPGESRRDLLMRNKAVFESIISPVVASGFSGIFLIATNPVDIMAHITQTISGFSRNRVIGTGTTLDTARLRYMLGRYFKVDPRNVHAYVIGEHGDSEFVPWSQALISTKPVFEMCAESNGEYSCKGIEEITEDVRSAAQKIIEAKNATYYGIGMAMVRITKAIFGNEHSVLTVSTLLEGEYGRSGVYAGVPCIIGVEGIERIISLSLTKEEQEKFNQSCDIIENTLANVVL